MTPARRALRQATVKLSSKNGASSGQDGRGGATAPAASRANPASRKK